MSLLLTCILKQVLVDVIVLPIQSSCENTNLSNKGQIMCKNDFLRLAEVNMSTQPFEFDKLSKSVLLCIQRSSCLGEKESGSKKTATLDDPHEI